MPQNPFYTFMEIQGTLKAEGNASEKIVFTSKNDSDYGGAGSASAGDWKNIVFTDTSSNSVLDYVFFRYGGQTSGEMIKIEGSSVDIKNSTIENSQSNGIYLKNSDSKIIDSIISDNQTGIIIETGNPEINGCQIKNNSLYGIDIKQDSAPKIKNNSFINNSAAAVYLKSSYPEFNNNSASNNGLNGVLVDSQTKIEQDETWEADLVYILESNFGDYVTVANGFVLTLEPGVVIKFRSQIYTAMVVEGTLLAQTASGSEIVFTSIKDDSFGGDTNNDGISTVPANNDWKEILFTSTSSGSVFDHVFMYYGSGQPPIILEGGAIVEIKDTVDYEP
jgi:parallel beta-helix repeat protein